MMPYAEASHCSGRERTGEHIKDTEIFRESLLGVARRGPSGSFPLCFPLQRVTLKKTKNIKHYSDLQR